MLGALMLAASVSAFVAAELAGDSTLVPLVGVLTSLRAAFFPLCCCSSAAVTRPLPMRTITFATLCFGADIALVGQMYHLPSDWPAGAMLVAIGALVTAAFTGKKRPAGRGLRGDGVMVMGRIDGSQYREVHWPFLLLFVPGCCLALGRDNRPVAHAAVSGAQRLAGGAADAAGRIQVAWPIWRDRDLGRLCGDRPVGAGARMARPFTVAADVGSRGFSACCSALKSAWPWKGALGHRMPSRRLSGRWRRGAGALVALAVLARERDRAGSSLSRPVPSASRFR